MLVCATFEATYMDNNRWGNAFVQGKDNVCSSDIPEQPGFATLIKGMVFNVLTQIK